MATKRTPQHNGAPRKKSKREKTVKVIVYIMIIAMILSTLTAGLAMFV